MRLIKSLELEIMSELPGDPSLPPGCRHSDYEDRERRRWDEDEREAKDDWWNAWVERRLAEEKTKTVRQNDL